MSITLNKVTLIGHLGNHIKLTYFDKGSCIGRASLATNEFYVDKTTNERIERTEWHRLVINNKAAEIFEKYTQKGDLLYIEGKLKTRQWQDEKEVTHYLTEIYVEEFKILNKVNSSSDKSNEPPSEQTVSKAQDVNDLPF